MEQSMKRIFLIVLDSCGVGYEPDADKFGDVGSDTPAGMPQTTQTLNIFGKSTA